MDIIFFNFSWMIYNSVLAALPVFFAWIFVSVRSRFLKVIFGCLWLAFLPNTIYLITDLVHFTDGWSQASFFEKIIVVLQYTMLEIFGLVTFVLALYPLEKLFAKSRSKKKQKKANNVAFFIVAVNFFIGFGIVLGRVERINSWEAFTHTTKVIAATVNIFTTSELLTLVILFGIIANVFYFLLRNVVIMRINKSLKKLL